MNATLRMRLGNYEPVLQLATGGMATVFVARQIGAAGFERLVVVKRVHRHLLSNHEFYDMFRDEARVASLVRHPNVVPVIDVVEADGELFLVQEYVESSALSTFCRAANDSGEPLAPAVVVRIIADTLAGLHAAHEAVDMRGNHLEVVHRDVSPQNIVVGVDGGSRLIDFGVAKARHRITETKSGSLKGKYGYMSPEQTKALPLDRRADLFSAGVVLHEALTGKRLFQGENEYDTLRRIVEGPIASPSSMGAQISPALDAVVAKSLERDREKRFQTAAEFLEALEHALRPAPPREVSAALEVHCGARLAERREALRDALHGDVPAGEQSTERLTIPSSPSSIRRLGEGTESQIASTQDARMPRPLKSRRVLALAMSVGAIVIGVAGAVIFVTGPSDSSHGTKSAVVMPTSQLRAPATTEPPLVAVSALPTASTPVEVADGVELVLHADAPIESVRAAGTQRLELHGKSATLVVAPWSGTLTIDAQLAGARGAHVDARASGPRDLTLEAPPAQPSPSARALKPRPGASPLPPKSELQSNPYGQP